MKDNGKRANRSALIMRRTSRAKAEDFWFILLNSPVAWKDSRFNCSWFWEALASEEAKRFTRTGTYWGPSFWRRLFSELAKAALPSSVLGNATVSSPELGRGENTGPWPMPANCVPYMANGPLRRPSPPAIVAILKSSTVTFDLHASLQNMADSLSTASKMEKCKLETHCRWYYHGVEVILFDSTWLFWICFFLLGPRLCPPDDRLPIPSPLPLSAPDAEVRKQRHIVIQPWGLPWINAGESFCGVPAGLPQGPHLGSLKDLSPLLILFFNSVLLKCKVNKWESVQGLRVFSLVIVKPKIPAKAGRSWEDLVSSKQHFAKWFSLSSWLTNQIDPIVVSLHTLNLPNSSFSVL